MTSRRAIKGVLQNFLGTFTSRYSDLDGYWLFGSLVLCIDRLVIDLMEPSSAGADTTPVNAARRFATAKFAQQLAKAGIPESRLREAHLEITKSPDSRTGDVNGHLCSGHDVTFVAHAVTDVGKKYESKICVFIAPHDPSVELRSTRAS